MAVQTGNDQGVSPLVGWFEKKIFNIYCTILGFVH